MAITYCGIQVELREVVLRCKPASMLAASAKGTVPVLVTPDVVIDESLDIMLWCLAQHDPEKWLTPLDPLDADATKPMQLIQHNDHEFKGHLDRYKYANPKDLASQIVHRQKGESFLARLDAMLRNVDCAQPFLYGDKKTLADVAILPFIRQFANVNLEWFNNTPYVHLQRWLHDGTRHQLFLKCMHKYPAWQPGDRPTIFGPQD